MIDCPAATTNDINQVDRYKAADAHARLAAHPLFAAEPATVSALAVSMQVFQAMPGTWLFREGASAGCCLLIATGRVEVLRLGKDGQERVHSLFDAGQLVAESALFMAHARYPMSARAQTQVRGYRLPRAALRLACASSPGFALRMLDWLGERIYLRTNEVDWLAASSAPQRLAAYLLALPITGNAVRIPIGRQQLAGRLGMRPETLSRLLSAWRRQGRLQGNRRDWRLCDPAFLRGLCSEATRPF